MLFPAKLACPVPQFRDYLPDVFSILLDHPTSLITSPPGCFQTSQLAGWLKSSGLPFAWLRLDPADQDPGTLLLSLISEVQQLHSSVGEETIQKLERLPGPIYGWAPLFACLAREITERVKHPFFIVLDHFHHLHANRDALDLLAVHFIPLLPHNGRCIIITHQKLPAAVLPGSTFYWDGRLPPMDHLQTIRLFHLHTIPSHEKDLHKIVQLTEGREGLLSNLIPLFQTLDKGEISLLLKKSNSTANLLRRVVDYQAASFTQKDLATLLIAQNIDYCHPSLFQKTHASSLHDPPIWIQPLAFDWERIRCSWKEPLWNALQQRNTKDIRQTLEAAAHSLVNLQEEEQALALYMRMENYPAAAQTLAALADRFMVQGRWYTLERWINRLPAPAAQPVPVTVDESGENLHEPTLKEHVHPDWVDKSSFQLSKAVTRSIRTEQPGSLFLQDRRVHAQFLLDLADSMKTPEKQFAYHADVYIHRLDTPGKWWLKSIHGQLPNREPVLVEFDTEELSPGTYMIDTRVLVREGEETASMPFDSSEEAAGTIHSNIFWVYG